MRLRRLYYGWYDPRRKTFLLSLYPPDAPVRPSLSFQSQSEATAMLIRKRAEVMWWPPLPQNLPQLSGSMTS